MSLDFTYTFAGLVIQDLASLFFDVPPIYFIVALNYSLLKDEKERAKSNFGTSDSEKSAAAVRAALLGSFKSLNNMENTILTASYLDISVCYTDIESVRNSEVDSSLMNNYPESFTKEPIKSSTLIQ